LGIRENNAEHPTTGSGEDYDSTVHHKNKYLYVSTLLGVYTVSGHCAILSVLSTKLLGGIGLNFVL